MNKQSILWGQMINKYGVKIHFAHRTFKWSNEAKGNAQYFVLLLVLQTLIRIKKNI